MKSGDSRGSGIDTVVVAWIIAVFAITALRALPLFFYHLNLSKLSFTSRIPIWVGIGIEVTAYAPTLAALLVVATVPGGGGIRRLLRPIGQWRVNVSWYVLALVGPSALFLVGDVVRLALGLALPPQWLIVPGAATLAFLIGALIAGSFGEEVGWRGLGQPRLQARYGALLAAVMIGAVWSLWHLWPAAAPGGLNLTTWSDGVLTFIRLIATSVVASTGNIFAGLMFPIAVAVLSFIVAFFVRETRNVRIWDEVDKPMGAEPADSHARACRP